MNITGRADQRLPQRDEVQALANEAGVEITSGHSRMRAVLGTDGTYAIETETRLRRHLLRPHTPSC